MNKRVHVLVVDDEALIRWSVSESLAARGMMVSQASDGASATRLIEVGPNAFDVIVLDLRLPDVNDLSLVAKVRRLSPHSRVIVMTAFDTTEITAKVMALGAMRMISKPFELDNLAALVDVAANAKNDGG